MLLLCCYGVVTVHVRRYRFSLICYVTIYYFFSDGSKVCAKDKTDIRGVDNTTAASNVVQKQIMSLKKVARFNKI